MSDVFAVCPSPACYLHGGCASLVANGALLCTVTMGISWGTEIAGRCMRSSVGHPVPKLKPIPTPFLKHAARAHLSIPPFMEPLPQFHPHILHWSLCSDVTFSVRPSHLPPPSSQSLSLIPLSSLALSPAGSPSHDGWFVLLFTDCPHTYKKVNTTSAGLLPISACDAPRHLQYTQWLSTNTRRVSRRRLLARQVLPFHLGEAHLETLLPGDPPTSTVAPREFQTHQTPFL